MNEALTNTKQVEPIDTRICKNPIYIIRMKNNDGDFLYTEEECLKLLSVFFDRAKKLAQYEKTEVKKRSGLLAKVSCYKHTGRGRLFWIDSE